MSSFALGRRRCIQLTTRRVSKHFLGSRNESFHQSERATAITTEGTAGRRASTLQFNQFPPQSLILKSQRNSELISPTNASFSSPAASQMEAIEHEHLSDNFETTTVDGTLRQDITTGLPFVIKNLDQACRFNQGKGGAPNGPNNTSKKKWNTDFVKQTVSQYEYYLKRFYNQEGGTDDDSSVSNEMKELFFSPETTQQAFVAVLRCRLPTHVLSQKIREWERYIGGIGMTKMTDSLSLSMLEANGKAGNVGRAIQLLSLRKSREYSPKEQEFVHAITAIDAASLYLRRNRNIFLAENKQPKIDDPTRWLDAILINMNQRDVALTTKMANRMLNIFTRTGKTGKMTHYFYRVVRKPIHGEEDDNENEKGDEIDIAKNNDNANKMATFQNRPVQLRINMRPPPPYHKIPSQVRGKLVRKPGSNIKQLKLERESDPDWSPVLTSAISFADSLKQGACGHDPVELDLISYSILMKVCVNRGSLWRAMHMIDEVMPANKIKPDIIAYNTLLIGLARVGDVPTMKEYTRQLLSNGLTPTKETIEASIDSLLNLGDVGNAITLCQDFFNQYSVLPPYTTHLKILEMTLGRGLEFEAKRHVSFIQQLWKWEQNKYHSEKFSRMLYATQNNPSLSKEALQKMFAYFGYTLDDSDFF
uniref:Pentacotripeptide-repeat region of PRORP domain-containing protein n=1 Tax=Pseudo-nitzschia australis TaxID=44445 RepID=A0A6U9YZR0_9STRA|mmetsp:Transcript_2911/g.6245  ORF Transcript_2911/g.6245 Transcript_2911/m.6245 type:complete len:648 (-) Transcript_2911:1387-3330(-)